MSWRLVLATGLHNEPLLYKEGEDKRQEKKELFQILIQTRFLRKIQNHCLTCPAACWGLPSAGKIEGAGRWLRS